MITAIIRDAEYQGNSEVTIFQPVKRGCRIVLSFANSLKGMDGWWMQINWLII
jgi:hypothetical protein